MLWSGGGVAGCFSGFRKRKKSTDDDMMKKMRTNPMPGRVLPGRTIIIQVCVLTAILLCQGCEKPEQKQEHNYLIRVEASYLTTDEFKKSLEIARIAYPYEMFKSSETGKENGPDSEIEIKALNEYKKKQLKIMKTRLLSQLTERLILHERARELDISVTTAELEQEITRVKSSYPENEFEKSLLESAVSFELWKKQLNDRMLMEKVISKDLGDEIEITSEELAESYKRLVGDDSKPNADDRPEIEKRIAESIRAKKVEAAYADWIQNLKKRYDIVINQEKWKEIEGP